LQKKLGCFAREKGEMAFCFAKRLVNQKGLKMDNILSTKEAFDALAEEYYVERKYKQGEGYFKLFLLRMPLILKFLGNVTGKKILDVGCGPGFHTSLLTKRGAVVKGIDISKEFIEIARRETLTAEFIIGDAEKLPFFNSEFDIVVAPLVLHYLNSWDQILKEIYAVLKKGGIFIFSHPHPVTHKLKQTKWFFKNFNVINDYFNEGGKNASMGSGNKKVTLVRYHKTYETIIKLSIKHGFEIIDYEDSRPLPEAKELSPEQYKTWFNYPPFCAWKVRKI